MTEANKEELKCEMILTFADLFELWLSNESIENYKYLCLQISVELQEFFKFFTPRVGGGSLRSYVIQNMPDYMKQCKSIMATADYKDKRIVVKLEEWNRRIADLSKILEEHQLPKIELPDSLFESNKRLWHTHE